MHIYTYLHTKNNNVLFQQRVVIEISLLPFFLLQTHRLEVYTMRLQFMTKNLSENQRVFVGLSLIYSTKEKQSEIESSLKVKRKKNCVKPIPRKIISTFNHQNKDKESNAVEMCNRVNQENK